MQKNSIVRDLVGDTVVAEESKLPIRFHLETAIEDIDGDSIATTTVVVRPKKAADEQKKARPSSCRVSFSLKGSLVKTWIEQHESANEMVNAVQDWANERTAIKHWLESFALFNFTEMVDRAREDGKVFTKPLSVFTDDLVRLFEAYDEWVVTDGTRTHTEVVLKNTEVVKKMHKMAVLEATIKLVNHLCIGWWGNQPIYRKITYNSNPQRAAQ